MGLRFRRSMKILPGIRLNFGKSSVGISAGVPGARVSLNSSGRVTGTAGIPGSGLYWVESRSIKKKRAKSKSPRKAASTRREETIIDEKIPVEDESTIIESLHIDGSSEFPSSGIIQQESTPSNSHDSADTIDVFDFKKKRQAELESGILKFNTSPTRSPSTAPQARARRA